MKVLLIVSLFVVMTLAEPPSYRQQSKSDRTYYFAKQQNNQGDAPYPASGWRPDGPAFELPESPQKQQAAPDSQYGSAAAAPPTSYGAPVQQRYGTPAQPQTSYGAPIQQQPQTSYGAPVQQQPQTSYGAPIQQQPQTSYGAPVQQQPQTSYGAPPSGKLESQYGAPQPQRQYGAPEGATTDYPNSDNEESTTATVPSGTESQAEPVDSVNELDEEGDVDEQQRQTGEYYVALPDGRLQRVQYMTSQDLAAMKYFAKIRAENVEPLRGAIYAYQPLQKLEFAPARLQVAVNEPVAVAPVVQISQKTEGNGASPAKLQVQPLAAEVPQGIGSPVSSSYTTYTANYQVPEQRYLVTF